jgi:hypothetical protein
MRIHCAIDGDGPLALILADAATADGNSNARSCPDIAIIDTCAVREGQLKIMAYSLRVSMRATEDKESEAFGTVVNELVRIEVGLEAFAKGHSPVYDASDPSLCVVLVWAGIVVVRKRLVSQSPAAV